MKGEVETNAVSMGVRRDSLLTNTPWGYIMTFVNIHQGGIVMDCDRDCGCCHRRKERDAQEVTALIHRLNRIEGQIRGIRGMVEKNAYCPDILVQASAVSAAVNAFNRELLASHIRTCVMEDIRAGKEETVEELLQVLQKLMK